jgi:hypothetical protein
MPGVEEVHCTSCGATGNIMSFSSETIAARPVASALIGRYVTSVRLCAGSPLKSEEARRRCRRASCLVEPSGIEPLTSTMPCLW